MSGTTSPAAIADMARAKFSNEHFDKIVGQTTFKIIQVLINQLSEVADRFPTNQWKGNIGCLALVLHEAKMRLLMGDKNPACRPTPKPDVVNLLIINERKGHGILKLKEDQKNLWQEYELQEDVDACGVTTIEQVVEAQYIEERRKEYTGYNEKTVHSLFAHI